MDGLARTAHRDDVEALAAAGVLDERGRAAALAWIRGRLDWATWMDRLLLGTGTALVLAGIVYFSAFNWFRIPAWVKFVNLELALVAGTVAAWRVGLERPGGKMLLMGCSVLVGVLLAVFGQVYQTGADAWELFAGWAALIGGWVAIGRLAPLWLMWIALVDVAIGLHANIWWGRHTFEWTMLALGAANGVALAAWEAGAARGIEWLRARWPRRTLWMTAVAPLTVLAIGWIWDASHVTVWLGALGWLAALGAGFARYRRGAGGDLTSLSIDAASAGIVALALLWRIAWTAHAHDPFFQMAVAAIAIAGGLGTWLKRVADEREVLE